MAIVQVRKDGTGDYTDIAAAIAGEAADLTATETLTINCVETTGVDSSLINIIGYTTNATNYIEIVGDGLYHVDWSLTSGNIGIYFQEQYCRVSGLILNDTNTADPAGETHFTRALSAGANSRLENCILRSTVTRVASSSGATYGIRAQNATFISRNNLVYNITRPTGGGSSYSIFQQASDYAVNCTAIGNVNQSSNANGIFGGNAINCYAGDFANVFSSQEAGGLVNCASSDTSGSSGLHDIPVDNTTFLDAANDDYTLASSSPLIAAGVGPSVNNNVSDQDFEGDERTGTVTDIGYDQLVDDTPPVFSAGPTIDNVGARQMDVNYTIDENSTVSVIALVGSGQAQPSDATFDAVEQTVAANTADTQTITGLTPLTTYTVWVRAADFSDNYTYQSIEQTTTDITPIISSVTPLRSGETATITCVDAGATQGSGGVTFDGVTCAIVSWSDTEVQFTVPNDGLQHKSTYDLALIHDNTTSDTESALAWLTPTGYTYAVAPAAPFQSSSVWSSIVGAAENDEFVYETTAELQGNPAVTVAISIDSDGNVSATDVSQTGVYEFDHYIIDASDELKSTNGTASVFLTTSGASDVIPDPINLGVDIVDAPTDSDIDINGTISGADNGIDLNVTLTNATISVAGGAHTAGPTTIQNGQSFVFRIRTSANDNTATEHSISVNGVSDSITVTTVAPGATLTGIIPDQSNIPGAAITPLDVAVYFDNPNNSNFSASGLPAGLSISLAGVISGNPTTNETANATVTLEGVDSNVFEWVISGALFQTNIPDQSHSIGATVSVDLDDYFDNPLGDTYSVDDLPDGVTLIGSIISGTVQTVEVDTSVVTLGNQTSNTFTWTITGETFSGTIPNQAGSVGAAITQIDLLGYFTNPENDTFTVDNLPAGLTLAGSTISGTPTAEETVNTIVTLDAVQSNQFTWTIEPADTTAPQLTAGPTAQNTQNATFDVAFTFDEDGEYRLIALPDGASAPTVDQVLAGTGNGGSTPSFDSGLQTMTADTEEVVTVRPVDA